MAVRVDDMHQALAVRADKQRRAVGRDRDAFGAVQNRNRADEMARPGVDHRDSVLGLEGGEQFEKRVAERDPMRRAAEIDTLDFIGRWIDRQHRMAKLGGRPQRTAPVHHHRMRGDIVAHIDGAFEFFRGEIDDRDAAVGIRVFAENAAAIDRGIDFLAVGRADHLVGGRRHVDFAGFRQRHGVEELNFVGALGGQDQIRPARAVVGVDHVAPLSRSSASAIFALRATASSRFSFSSSTTSSGARATKLGLPSLPSTRAISASALAISLASRARSAARSMMPFSGSAATSPRTTSCTEPCGALAADEISDTRASRLMKSAQRVARALVSFDAPASTKGIAAAMFISARMERMAVTRSITQPTSSWALT